MADVSKLIERYIADVIRLPKGDVSEAVASREWFLKRIRSVISKRHENGTREPELYKDPFIYFGSYFKKTKVAAVDEFDVLVVIDSNTGQFSVGGEKLGEGLGDLPPRLLPGFS
ncbi:MAG TPA: hypothetical protein VK971_02490 [Thiohalobacter sp.]|nr:hypothetical protein [Thiohalobacter sp.]